MKIVIDVNLEDFKELLDSLEAYEENFIWYNEETKTIETNKAEKNLAIIDRIRAQLV